MSTLRALVLSDFNPANLVACLTHDEEEPRLAAEAGPYGDVGDLAPDQGEASGSSPHDVAVVWTRPEGVSPSFAALVGGAQVAVDDVLADVDAFVSTRLTAVCARAMRVMVMTWSVPRLSAAFGALAMKEGVGLANVVMRMNLRLAERIEALPGVVLLDASAWGSAERTPEDAKLWYAAKIPYRMDVFRRATRQVKSALRAALGGSRKLVVVDLDDTLWGGIVGDVGWSSVRLGGHDPIGEAYVDFQRALLALSRRGILLAVVSKNEESVALEAIGRHPEMVLRASAFAAWRINWQDKAANIEALARDLNLGLQSVVFIDDNPAERGRVREALPDVLVPEWPSSPLQYVDALLKLGCFDTVVLTGEDRARGAAYAAEAARVADRGATESLGEWLRRLDLSVEVEELNDRNLPRVVQLLNKTNQMNLSTRRMDEAALLAWVRAGRRPFWTFRVRDRFGDAGLTGLASLDLDGPRAVLVDFVLSCRVFGRGVEDAMLHIATDAAREAGASIFSATFMPTAKNMPCLRFLEASGLERIGQHEFRSDLSVPHRLPAEIQLVREMASTS